VNLPGGTLFITVTPENASAEASFTGVQMRGPAETVFEAAIDPRSVPAV
jgi:hypothetical protein